MEKAAAEKAEKEAAEKAAAEKAEKEAAEKAAAEKAAAEKAEAEVPLFLHNIVALGLGVLWSFVHLVLWRDAHYISRGYSK